MRSTNDAVDKNQRKDTLKQIMICRKIILRENLVHRMNDKLKETQ